MRLDLLRIIEAAYRWDPDEEEWLRSVAHAATPLDHGLGIYARIDDLSDPDRPHIKALAFSRVPETLIRGGRAMMNEGHAAGPVEINRALYERHPPVGFALDRVADLPAELRGGFAAAMAAIGIEDTLGIFARDVDGVLVHLGIPMAKRRRVHPRTLHRLACVAAHLTSAVRLRLAGAPSPDAATTDAVLEPTGAVCHAAGEARGGDVRARLSATVKRLERARGPLRRSDPDESLAIWRGLLDGRWSLVDHWDSDGKRFVLARRNAPRARDPRALTRAEGAVVAFLSMGYSSKYVAYLLGLSATTVASHFSSARRKLGVRSQQELIALFSSRRRGSPDESASRRAGT